MRVSATGCLPVVPGCANSRTPFAAIDVNMMDSEEEDEDEEEEKVEKPLTEMEKKAITSKVCIV